MFKEIGFGFCVCKCEPRGDNGLEGYQLHDRYLFRVMRDENIKARSHYRVFPVDPLFFETCSFRTFNKFFEREEEI